MSTPNPLPDSFNQAAAGDSNNFPPPPLKKTKNTLGLIALVCSVLGLIFSCVKGALMLGWILLPIGFILGIVSLFSKDKPRGKGIAAIIISIVGTIVAVAAFFLLVANAVDDATSSTGSAPTTGLDATKDSNDQSQSSDSNANGAGTTRDNPLPIGSTVEDNEWSYTINSVTLHATDQVLAANSFNSQPDAGMEYILVNATITYKGSDPQGATPLGQVKYVSVDGNTFSQSDSFAVPADALDSLTTLFGGASVTGNIVLSAPIDTAEQGVLSVSPSLLTDAKFVAVQ